MGETSQIREQRRTPLHHLYAQHGAKVVPFAGFELPLSFDGVINEHLATRNSAGLFDVSHMGIVDLFPKAGRSQTAVVEALERITPAGIAELENNQLQYALLTNEHGGAVDDFIVSRNESRIRLVLNASQVDVDLAYMKRVLVETSDIMLRDDLAQIALQGPKAVSALAELNGDVADLSFMTSGQFELGGVDCEVSRSGYTGEDGFEIIVDSQNAAAVADSLLTHSDVTICGLGARDSLRLEAGLCLYGHELNEGTTPIEARLGWTIPRRRRDDATFAGSEVILDQISSGTHRTRVGISSLTKRPIREGAILVTEAGQEVGTVTSGGFGPTYQGPIAMGYVTPQAVRDEAHLIAHARGKEFPCRIADLPFVPHNYRRN